MVATRRQVQSGPNEELVLEQDPDQLLKKKAARKPTVRAAAIVKTKAKSKKAEIETVDESSKPAPRITRTKKSASDVEPNAVDDGTVVVGGISRATKVGSVRGRKVDERAENVKNEDDLRVSRPARSTKTASVRGRKALAAVEEPSEEIAVQSKERGAGSLRGRKRAGLSQDVCLPAPSEPQTTRSTRGTAKSAPLSPKKITQVSKAPVKTARQIGTKPVTRTTRSRAQVETKSLGKRRTVSDENADVREFDANLDDAGDGEDMVTLASTPFQKSIASDLDAKLKQPVVVAESEASMSSRPTTPSDSPIPNFNNIDEEEGIGGDEGVEFASESEQNEAGVGDVSEDELCGPKTPMKRSLPSALVRYQFSVQRTVQKHAEDNRLETPAIRYAVLGTQRGTPQTQKPYCKPAVPASEVRPMTVSRASGRAFVFHDLNRRSLSPLKAVENTEEQEEPSFVIDEDIIPTDATGYEENSSIAATQTRPFLDLDEAQLVANSLVEEDAEDYVVPANVQKYSDDFDDTIIIAEADEEVEAVSEVSSRALESEDSVVPACSASPVDVEKEASQEAESTQEHSDDDSIVVHPLQRTSTPKSAPIQPIHVNFDEHFSGMFTLGEGAQVCLDDDEVDASVAAGDHNDDQLGAIEIKRDISVIQEPGRRQTFDLDQFIDVAALAEPTMRGHFDIGNAAAVSAICSVQNDPEVPKSNPTLDNAMDRFHWAQSDDCSNDQDAAHASIVDIELEATTEEHYDANGPDSLEVHEYGPQEAEEKEVIDRPETPHYAFPTLAFDARRKSLPILSLRTPIRTAKRPNTSDGASMPRVAKPFSHAPWSRKGINAATNTPSKTRSSTARSTPNVSKLSTPLHSPKTGGTDQAIHGSSGNHPFFPTQTTYASHRSTVAAPVRFATPRTNSPKRRDTFHRALTGKLTSPVASTVPWSPTIVEATTPKERYPVLRPCENYEEHAHTVAPAKRFYTPIAKSPSRRQTFHKALPGQGISAPATVQPGAATVDPVTPVAQTQSHALETGIPGMEKVPGTLERYPRRPPQQDYMTHARTAAGPRRFDTPVTRSLKRPATAGKPASLRFANLATTTPPSSHTPMKTPLKSAAMTPSQIPMTPHPAAPLRGVVALVEVFTLEGASASAPFISLLNRLGAKTTRTWNDRITHVVFKDGSPTTLQRVRLNKKDFEETGEGSFIHCVNSRWVTDCDTEGRRANESEDAYVVNVAEVPRGGKRRRKSMEPSALLNVGGNIVRDRKSSGGRVSSFGHSPVKCAESPAKLTNVAEVGIPLDGVTGKENKGEEHSSPATPAWIAAPSQLVQQTAPMKRVRKLELSEKVEAKSRRLTFWNGAA